MSSEKMIHICDSATEIDRMNATIAVLSRLFPDAAISKEQWIGANEREISDKIYASICSNRSLFQLVVTNILGIHFLVPKVLALQNAPAVIISSCLARKKIQRFTDSMLLDMSNIPSINSTQTSSVVAGEQELRYSDKICIALSKLGVHNPFYVQPSTYAHLRDQENSCT